MNIKAFVYVDLKVSIPFDKFAWAENNPGIRAQPGFINKTWLSGVDNNSVGGFYAFDSIENAKHYALVYLPKKCKELNIGFSASIFDAAVVGEASKDMNSPFFA